MGACAAPPTGWVAVTPIEAYLWSFGPAVLIFFVLAYNALGSPNVAQRWFRLFGALGAAFVIFFLWAMIPGPFYCGTYVPPS